MALVHIKAIAQVRIVSERLQTLIGQRQRERQRCVGQCHGRRARDATRHVSYTVVDHVIDHVGGLLVRRRLGGFETAPLVNRHIDDHGARLHPCDVVTGY